MRNLTKASRDASRTAQFESLIKNGYNQETYKGLEIFKDSTNLLLKVFIGNAANHSIFYKYRSIEQLEAKIQEVKKSFDMREQYKAEQKEKNKGKKSITLATLKAFLKKNESNIYIKVKSSFDGMQDMVVSVEDEFSKVTKSETPQDYNLGFSGLYLVGSSRDSISIFENDDFEGFHVYNSCGACIVATPKQATKKEQPKASGKIQIVDYSEKAIAVIGEISDHYDNLINLGGSYNSRLKCGKGIIFSKKRLEDVKSYFLAQNQASEADTQQEEETPEIEPITLLHPELEAVPPLNICDPESGQYKEALQEAQILPTPNDCNLQLESFKIIWHEGYQAPSYEGAIFDNWADVQRAFYNLWERNEKGQGGGYTKVKCEIKLQNREPEVCRIDITDKEANGDFNPSAQHITEYLVDLFEDENETAQQITELFN